MKDVVLKISGEFSDRSLTSYFELWTVGRRRETEGDGWKNREYLLTEAAVTTKWSSYLLLEHAPGAYRDRKDQEKHNKLLAAAPIMEGEHNDFFQGVIMVDGPQFYRMSWSHPACETLGVDEVMKRWVHGQCDLWVKKAVEALEADVLVN